MIKIQIQFFGGRGADSGISFDIPSSTPRSNYTPVDLAPDLKAALGNKKDPFSVGDALSLSNPNFSSPGYSDNCTRCVVAYELRRRGYDVTALPTYGGDKWQDVSINGIAFADRWKGAFRRSRTDRVGSGSASKTLDNIKQHMQKYGSGSRAVINIHYADTDINHVFNVENAGGRILFLDAQSGQRYNQKSMLNLLRRTSGQNTSLTRTDNLRISNRARDFIKTQK